MKGLTGCMCINSRPDNATTYKCLSQFSCNPSQGHVDTAKYILKYLSTVLAHGLWFKQHDNRSQTAVSTPITQAKSASLSTSSSSLVRQICGSESIKDFPVMSHVGINSLFSFSALSLFGRYFHSIILLQIELQHKRNPWPR